MHKCIDCEKEFETGQELGGHKRLHSRDFDSLKLDRSRRVRLILERGHTCEVCLLKKWNEKDIPLELDHVDGNPENNKKENLRVICPNCHAQTNTYKGRNVGKVTNSKRQSVMKKHQGKYR